MPYQLQMFDNQLCPFSITQESNLGMKFYRSKNSLLFGNRFLSCIIFTAWPKKDPQWAEIKFYDNFQKQCMKHSIFIITIV